MVFGALLMILGVGGYALAATSSLTAFIPALFGVALLGLGVLARSESARKHAMHAAATVALVGFAGAVFRIVSAPAGGGTSLALSSQIAMALLTGAFVALCVKSFIDARRRRAAAQS